MNNIEKFKCLQIQLQVVQSDPELSWFITKTILGTECIDQLPNHNIQLIPSIKVDMANMGFNWRY